MALLKIIKLSTKTWKHNSDVDGDFILTKFYAKQEDNEFLLVETYGAKRRKYLISEIEVYDIGGTAETFSNFTDLFLRLEELKYPAFYVDGEFTFNPASYDLSEFANAETDKFVKESEVLSNDISTYTPATTPLAGTEKALIHDGTDFKEVAVSEFGGGATIESELQKYWFSYIASYVTSAVLYTNVASGNLTTTGTQSLIGTTATSLYSSFHFLNWVGATTAGANAGIKNSNSADAYYRQGVKAYFIFSNNDTNTAHSTAVGMYGLFIAIPNVAIASFTTDFVGVGNDAGDTNLSLYCKRNNAPASYIKLDCGSNFPAHTAGTDVFMLEFESNKTSVQADLVITLTLTNLITGDIFTHTFTGLECPDLNKGMFTTINRNNRGSGATPVIRWVKTFVERKLF